MCGADEESVDDFTASGDNAAGIIKLSKPSEVRHIWMQNRRDWQFHSRAKGPAIGISDDMKKWKQEWKSTKQYVAFIVVAFIVVVACLSVLLLQGCSRNENDTQPRLMRLATTTSVRDSGLLEVLLEPFEKSHRCRIDVVAVGTGAALKLGENGDADALIVHAPEAEAKFMSSGFGVRRDEFMHNYFVLLGPKDDPAEATGRNVSDALGRIAKAKCKFISRGDNSGTHMRELELWEAAGGRSDWRDYIESGQGMGATLIMADNFQGYVLADQGTLLNFKEKVELTVQSREESELLNRYSVIVVSADRSKDAASELRTALADQLADYLISDEATGIIRKHQVAGQQLFFPGKTAGKTADKEHATD